MAVTFGCVVGGVRVREEVVEGLSVLVTTVVAFSSGVLVATGWVGLLVVVFEDVVVATGLLVDCGVDGVVSGISQ